MKKAAKATRAGRAAALAAGRSVINSDPNDRLLLVKEHPDGTKTYFRLPKGEGQATAPLGPFTTHKQ